MAPSIIIIIIIIVIIVSIGYGPSIIILIIVFITITIIGWALGAFLHNCKLQQRHRRRQHTLGWLEPITGFKKKGSMLIFRERVFSIGSSFRPSSHEDLFGVDPEFRLDEFAVVVLE